MKTIIKLCALALCLSTHVYAASNHLSLENNQQQPVQTKKLCVGMLVTTTKSENGQPVFNVLDEHDQVVDTLNVPLSFIQHAAKVGDNIYAMGSGVDKSFKIFRMNNDVVTQLDHQEMMDANHANVAPDGSIYVEGHDKNFNYKAIQIKGNDVTTLSFPFLNRLTEINLASDGSLYVSGKNDNDGPEELFHVKGNTHQQIHYGGRFIWTLLPSSDGGVYVNTYDEHDKAVVVFINKEGSPTQLQLPSNRSHYLMSSDADGGIYIKNDEQVIHMRHGHVKSILPPIVLKIKKEILAPDGSVYVAGVEKTSSIGKRIFDKSYYLFHIKDDQIKEIQHDFYDIYHLKISPLDGSSYIKGYYRDDKTRVAHIKDGHETILDNVTNFTLIQGLPPTLSDIIDEYTSGFGEFFDYDALTSLMNQLNASNFAHPTEQDGFALYNLFIQHKDAITSDEQTYEALSTLLKSYEDKDESAIYPYIMAIYFEILELEKNIHMMHEGMSTQLDTSVDTERLTQTKEALNLLNIIVKAKDTSFTKPYVRLKDSIEGALDVLGVLKGE